MCLKQDVKYVSIIPVIIQTETNIYVLQPSYSYFEGKTWRSDAKFSTKSALAEFNGCGFPIPSITMTTRDHGRCSWGSQEEEQRRLENAEDGCRALSENKIRFWQLPFTDSATKTDGFSNQNILTFPIKKRLLSNQKVYIRNLQSQKRSCHGKSLALTAQCLSSFSVRTWAWQ